MRRRVVLVTTDSHVQRRVADHLSRKGFVVQTLQAPDTGPEELLAARGRGKPASAVVLEFPQPDGRGAELIHALAPVNPRPALLALCPHGMIEAGIAALKEGADDYLLAPFDPEELELKLERALEQRQLREELERMRAVQLPARPPQRELTGSSPLIGKVRKRIALVARGSATVLITGETGTGKELAATAIHEASPRRHRRIVKVNCAALPDPLLESELFGYERGAFTGAEQRRIGRFEEAHQGTLFLDEVGDMQVRTQAKVLRALQEQEFERLGGTRPIRVDVRVIAATNQDLRELIARGRFREDLFFRLNVVPIELPPLRERREDIPELTELYLEEFSAGSPWGKPRMTPRCLEALMAYSWPGNVRELCNTLERAVLMSESDEIDVHDLGLPSPAGVIACSSGGEALVLRLPEGGVDHRDVERELILQALERTGWVQKDAARLLHMSRRKLNYRIQRLGISHPGWRRNRARAADPAEEDPDIC
ncbi:MAG: sigma-54 dependent transcriptional regulator [Deltaproteobacteria bacterium]|nr:sigma-54 dependent transcriptional regulator [Deltaproteobacteria bacterium]